MAEKKSAKSNAPRGTGKLARGFTADERAAMREHVEEQKAEAGRASRADNAAAAEGDVLAKIAAMPESDRVMAERLHALIKTSAPALSPKLWYGMPAYANKNGNVVCFFQDARKFKTRYATLGFSDKARLDDGNMWPNAYALKELTPAEEAKIVALVKKAIS